MVREIMKDEVFLAEASEKATAEDTEIARDLLETLEAHKAGCVGMAANMNETGLRFALTPARLRLMARTTASTASS